MNCAATLASRYSWSGFSSGILRPPPLELALGRLALGLKAALLRGLGGSGGTALFGNHERIRKPPCQACEGLFTVACLRALVLCDRRDPRSDARHDALALPVGQRRRSEHIEACFNT